MEFKFNGVSLSRFWKTDHQVYPSMDCINHIKKIVERILSPLGDDIYLVDLTVSAGGAVNLVLDSDKNLTLATCAFVNKELNRELDQLEGNFSIKVMSSGVGEPLQLKRQYVKNIGKKLEINTFDNQIISGKISQADDRHVEISWSKRQKKDIGKGKHTVHFTRSFHYDEIRRARVVI